jgi:hypothetical protein
LRTLAAIFAIALPAGWVIALPAGWTAFAATEPAPKPVSKMAGKVTTPSKTPIGKTAGISNGSKTGASKTVSTKAGGPVPQTVSKHPVNTGAAQKKNTTKPQASNRYRRSAQVQPAPDRYKEIQQALADKGYFAGPVDGNWSPASVDALKRFQHDQSLNEDGKIGSLSVIALGLGPRRGDLTPLAAPAHQPEPVSDPGPARPEPLPDQR